MDKRALTRRENPSVSHDSIWIFNRCLIHLDFSLRYIGLLISGSTPFRLGLGKAVWPTMAESSFYKIMYFFTYVKVAPIDCSSVDTP